MSNLTRIRTQVETCTGHRLMEYVGKCSHPHGHNYLWVAELDTEITARKYGMQLDFSSVKHLLQSVTEPFDHAFVVRNDDSALIDTFRRTLSRYVILSVNPTAENLAVVVARQLYEALEVPVTVTLHETRNHSVTVPPQDEYPAIVQIEEIFS